MTTSSLAGGRSRLTSSFAGGDDYLARDSFDEMALYHP
jgi:hypothetical protein